MGAAGQPRGTRDACSTSLAAQLAGSRLAQAALARVPRSTRIAARPAGYKNLVGARRASWRILQSVEQSELSKGNEKRVKLIQKYRAEVEKELDGICGEILELLDSHLIPSASSCEASVFYLKMKADYHRYLSEFKVRAAAAVPAA